MSENSYEDSYENTSEISSSYLSSQVLKRKKNIQNQLNMFSGMDFFFMKIELMVKFILNLNIMN